MIVQTPPTIPTHSPDTGFSGFRCAWVAAWHPRPFSEVVAAARGNECYLHPPCSCARYQGCALLGAKEHLLVEVVVGAGSILDPDSVPSFLPYREVMNVTGIVSL